MTPVREMGPLRLQPASEVGMSGGVRSAEHTVLHFPPTTRLQNMPITGDHTWYLVVNRTDGLPKNLPGIYLPIFINNIWSYTMVPRNGLAVPWSVSSLVGAERAYSFSCC